MGNLELNVGKIGPASEFYTPANPYGIMPLWRDNLHNYSNFSPYFFINILYSYVRLALINVLLVRTLAIWRVKREDKKQTAMRRGLRRILHIV